MSKLTNLSSSEIEEFQMEDLDVATNQSEFESSLTFPLNTDIEASFIEVIPKCEFLTGGAGTGKTFEINRRMEEYKTLHPNRDRSYGVLAATTGIAAINMGGECTTVNSALKYFDTNSLEESFNSGKLQQSLKDISKKANYLIIDEISMMHAKQLDIIWDALVEINQHEEIKERGGLGIILTGDFCQLPPVPDKDPRTDKSLDVKYAFEAQCWKYFESNTTKLTKNWRQDDLHFILALEAARKGNGEDCSILLKRHKGVRFCEEIETNFEGTTIFSKNIEVDRLNQTRLRNLLHSGKRAYSVKSFRWGKQRGEWKNIPESLDLCEECYVMILANDSKANGFRYANGSTGYVVRFSYPKSPDELLMLVGMEDEEIKIDFDTPNTFRIKLKDKVSNIPGEQLDISPEVEISKICRQVSQKDHPNGNPKPEYQSLKEWKEDPNNSKYTVKQAKFQYELMYLGKLTQENMKSSHQFLLDGKCKCGWPYSSQVDSNNQAAFEQHKNNSSPEIYFDYAIGKWIVGEIYYYPLRIAYATTVHKSQGLTLDRVQIDFINQFFGQPSMAYVALSRCKTAEGMRLVGSSKLLAERINVSRKVIRFI